VAIDCTSLLEPLTGVGVFLDESLRRLAADEALDLTAFAVTWRGRGRLRGVVPPGVDVVTRVMAAQPLRQAWMRANGPRIDRWIGTHDVVHGPNFVVPPARAATVVSVHDMTPMRFPEMCNRDTLQYPVLLRRALARGAWVHTDSEFVRGEVIELLGADPDRVVTVPLGVRTVGAGDPTEGHRLAGGDRYVLALGTVEPRKDLPSLVHAFDALASADRDLRLVIIGKDGWGAAGAELDDAIASASSRDRVKRLGYLGNEDRVALMRGATVYAYPSRYEGFGLPPLEAMSAGIPVVATTAGSLPEVLGDGALLVPPDDVDALVQAIARVLQDGALRDDLVARGHATTSRWSWERCAAGLSDLYHLAARGEPVRTIPSP
jgi:glycosyltransferase involved in cell wall biosynthesis